MRHFESFCNALSEFIDKYGHANVPHNYQNDAGMKLGVSVSNIRNGRTHINTEEAAKLAEMGFFWSSHDYYFERWRKLLKDYIDKYGNANVPENYRTPDGYSLGARMTEIRMGRIKLSEEEKKILTDMGFSISRIKNKRTSFEDFCKLMHEYYAEYQNYRVKVKYITKEGIRLGMIIRNMKSRKINLSDEQVKLLKDEFGIIVKEKI